jgi:hypothetical protein
MQAELPLSQYQRPDEEFNEVAEEVQVDRDHMGNHVPMYRYQRRSDNDEKYERTHCKKRIPALIKFTSFACRH